MDDNPATQQFLKTARNHKLLTREDEIRLFKQYRKAIELLEQAERDDKGDFVWTSELRQAAKDKEAAWHTLIGSNLRLVCSMARTLSNKSGRPMDEAIQDGVLGLMRAVERFDYRKGFKLSTYATWWISQSITRNGQHDQLVYVPVYRLEQIHELVCVEREFEQLENRVPTDSELDEILEWTPGTVAHLRACRRENVSMSAPIGTGRDTLGDMIEDESSPRTDQRTHVRSLKEFIAKRCPQVLSDREWFILVKRYGLDGEGETSLEEIGQMLAKPVTRTMVRHLQLRAETRLGRVIDESDVF